MSKVILLGPVLEWPIEQGENPTCKGHGQGWTNSFRGANSYWVCAESTCYKPSAGQLRYCEWCEQVWLAMPTASIPDPRHPRNLMHPICKNEFEGI